MNAFQKNRIKLYKNMKWCLQYRQKHKDRTRSHKWMSYDVRNSFLNYFKTRDHLYVHSSTVLPNRDEGSYFINAGMNQFKPIILGTVDQKSEMATYKRVVNSQKCIRVGGKHNDLEDVGRDTHHHTFFEMLGSWSFGDYFKERACEMAWDLITNVYEIPPDKLYVTYFAGSDVLGLKPDLECKEIWKRIGVPESHIFGMGVSDNFWDMGDTGPCGPCTEIHYDCTNTGLKNLHSAADNASLRELWNLVFMQYDRQSDGRLKALPCHHVDTGMGLERITAVLQGHASNYDTDLFRPLFDVLWEKGNCPQYGTSVGADAHVIDRAYRIVADHARMFTVTVGDGLLPGRGESQVKLKNIINRSIRQCRDILTAPQGTVGLLVPVVVDILGDAFPELKQHCSHVVSVINEAEDRYLSLREDSNNIMKKALSKFDLKPGDALSCEQMYQLCDGRFGRQVPLDILYDIAQANDILCDSKYEEYIEQTKSVCSASTNEDSRTILDQHDLTWLRVQEIPATDISSVYDYEKKRNKYVFHSPQAAILAIKKGSSFVKELESISNEQVVIILDKTCFYAERGGQVGDLGYISSVDGAVFQVEDTQVMQGYIQHLGKLCNGKLKVGAKVTPTINHEHRKCCMLNHSGTHIINYCLNRLSGGARQQGSLVTPSSLHFEFSLNESEMLTSHIIDKVTTLANKIIEDCQPVFVQVMDFQMAKEIQGLSFLPSKAYPTDVRVVSFGIPVNEVVQGSGLHSVELCCGTHVSNTGDLEALSIISIEGEGQFSKRLVAVTGARAKEVIEEGEKLRTRVRQLKDIVHKNIQKEQWISERKEIGQILGVGVIPRSDRDSINKELVKLDRQLHKAAAGRTRIKTQISDQTTTDNQNVVHIDPAKPRDVIKVLVDLKIDRPVVILFQNTDHNHVLNAVCSVPQKQNTSAGITAENLAKEVCRLTEGSMQVPNKAYSQSLLDMFVVKCYYKDTLNIEVTHIKTVISKFLDNIAE